MTNCSRITRGEPLEETRVTNCTDGMTNRTDGVTNRTDDRGARSRRGR